MPAALVPPGQVEARVATLKLNQREIVTLRAHLLGASPARRVERAEAALKLALANGGTATQIRRSDAGLARRFELAGITLFLLAPDDLDDAQSAHAGLGLDVVARDVERRLANAVREQQEATEPRQLALGAAWSLGASLVAWLVVRALVTLRRRGMARVAAMFEHWQQRHTGKAMVSTYAAHVRSGVQHATTALYWGLVLLVADLWFTFVLRQFAYTRPWGERATDWLLDVLSRFVHSAVGAVPGLLTAMLIFLLARLATRANTLFMDRVERGDVEVGWLDIDTAGPTRRLANALVWLFALAMAYPYLPGAGSEAFKGVSVLAGVMLSLGASGVVGQAMSGLSLMYSRALRPGEYVRIGETEGTVQSLGMFATRIHTGMGEEVSVPNTVILGQPVRNFSRLVQGGRFVLHTSVTIGYNTPWRQVHELLLEGARRTAGVSTVPPPYVVQTALSDFYVEYRLCAQSDNSAPSRRAEAMSSLHGNILDTFNEAGVQIMSPHYRADPAEPQVVPAGAQFAPFLPSAEQARA
ncbi:MAG: mechanosensitive ion channel [Burkholderiales bacterium]|nr:mechanosensitive ion channel [Burkholderiales bacterium]